QAGAPGAGGGAGPGSDAAGPGVGGGAGAGTVGAATAGGAGGAPGAAAGVRTGSGGSGRTGGPAAGAGASPSGGGAPAVGVTKDAITISAIAGFSGNYGAILTEIYDNGFGTWLDDVNAHGGIHARKVVVKKVVNHDTVERRVSTCKVIQNNGTYLTVSIVGFRDADVRAVDCLEPAV